MKNSRGILLMATMLLVLAACQKDMIHEKYIQNSTTADTITVVNPDFDTVFTIYPGTSSMIYSFTVLDRDQPQEACKWLGDTLWITNQDDSTCDKLVTIEENWQSIVTNVEKRQRLQTCTFIIQDGDF
ncbi:hypothetical protein K6119_02700 [Paracrocinitomix mangrovi]|uniref:hypothetical protein n=1 Tax=Paracrocinitomix mangrovi TaxID=2862509 RepID=UPI001C8F0DC1|nr:hypothetical protein [Paracrocinitomix mangrovi]UKN02429.1 hypothetical protein K6119_02700 [Paracrocinitomix mangrovi]